MNTDVRGYQRAQRRPIATGSGRYRLDARVAIGNTTSVWRATDLLLGRTVAVKRLRARAAGDETTRRRFANEIRITASMHQRSVVDVVDADANANRPYLVTEWVEGESLDIVLRRGHLPPSTAIRIAGALARALSHVHGRGVIHCDVKPANILIRNDGQVKLADFGIATPIGAAGNGTVFGSIHYMSPERLLGEPPGPQCDVYALGVTLYEMITGRQPFTGDSPFDVAVARRTSARLPASSFVRIPASVESALRRALAQDPAQRFRSAAGFAQELAAVDRSFVRHVKAG